MATVTYIKETRQHPSAMVSVMRYCLQESKTVDGLTGQRYVSGIGCDGLNSITEFLATKYAYGKLDGMVVPVSWRNRRARYRRSRFSSRASSWTAPTAMQWFFR